MATWPYIHALCSLYVQCVDCKYGKATVVFDEYQDGPSTKSHTHERRVGMYRPTATCESDMVAKVKKNEFLANKANKHRFINHLGDRLVAQLFMPQGTQIY